MSQDKNMSMFGQKYDLPEDRDGFVDDSSGEVVEKKDLKPIDVIKAVAKQMGQEIDDPNPNCKHCYGRGYIGRDSATKAPVPCSCIHASLSEDERQKNDSLANKMRKLPRKQRRKIERQFKNKMKRDRKRIQNQIDIGELEVDENNSIIEIEE